MSKDSLVVPDKRDREVATKMVFMYTLMQKKSGGCVTLMSGAFVELLSEDAELHTEDR